MAILQRRNIIVIQYNILNVKLYNLKLSKLKPRIKNCTEVTLKISLNAAGYSKDENNFPH